MRLTSGITFRLFAWYFLFVLIFCGVVLLLYTNVREIMKMSENIVNKHYIISSYSKKMIENLLEVEENEQKYLLLGKQAYLNYAASSRKAFERHLDTILRLESVSGVWMDIRGDYRKFSEDPENATGAFPKGTVWLPEPVITGWIKRISKARAENERDLEAANRELNRRGRMTVRSAVIGLGVSLFLCIMGSLFLADSMIRPLRKMIAGIRSISGTRTGAPIDIRSRDEFGELAGAFNEMALRLEEEQRMRSDFIAMLSHEIRTPLTSIQESVNLIEEGIMGEINPRQRKFLEIAGAGIGRVCDLLNRLMQVSRLESGETVIRPRLIDPHPIVNECVEHMRHLAGAKEMVIHTDIDADMPDVRGEPEYVKQVLLNLIGNAIKFSPRSGNITVRTGLDEARVEAVFSVADEGDGISEEDRQFIFNKYYRGQKVRDQMDGVGLGLGIAKHIVRAHGGRLWFESEVGKGSVFYFTLPLAGEWSNGVE